MNVEIVSYPDAVDALRGSGGLDGALEAIFFEASNVKSFADNQARDAFRWLWFGRYLAQEPEHAFVALGAAAQPLGYLVGSLSDPAKRPEFAELRYFQDFADLTPAFPAHLHINLATPARNQGIGGELIATFAAHAAANGAPGMHVVTGHGARNVGFYQRQGFVELAVIERLERPVVMLGRRLLV